MSLDRKFVPGSSWGDLVKASLLRRLRDFIDLRQDIRQLQHALLIREPLSGQLAFSYTARAQSIRHRDHGMALLSAVGVFVSILVTCAIWIATGWPEGSAAPMMAAVACCFFATFDDPAPYIVSFANSAIVGAVFAAVYLFAVLPHATTVEMLVPRSGALADPLRPFHGPTTNSTLRNRRRRQWRQHDRHPEWRDRGFHAVCQFRDCYRRRHVDLGHHRYARKVGWLGLERASS